MSICRDCSKPLSAEELARNYTDVNDQTVCDECLDFMIAAEEADDEAQKYADANETYPNGGCYF
jgi:hypothetical protein